MRLRPGWNRVHRWAVFCLAASSLWPALSLADGLDCGWCRRGAIVKEVEGMSETSVLSRLAERLTTPCFHLQNKGVIDLYRQRAQIEGWEWLVKPSRWKPPEYYFTASYEEDLPGPVKSRMAVRLFFHDGRLIDEWISESERPTATYRSHIQRLFNNPTALLRQAAPIEGTLRDFERTPTSVLIRTEHDWAGTGETLDIEFSRFEDGFDRAPQGFNRILVGALEGEIVGGTAAEIDPALKVFRLGDGPIRVRYQAPASCEALEDRIQIYNACSVLPSSESSLAETEPHDRIAERRLGLRCRGSYSFRKIASTMGVPGMGGVPLLGAMNNKGQVVYWKSIPGPGYYRLVVGDGSIDTVLLETRKNGRYFFTGQNGLTISDSGTVAYCGSEDTGMFDPRPMAIMKRGAFTITQPNDPGLVKEVRFCNRPVINDRDTVVYGGRDEDTPGEGKRAVFRNSTRVAAVGPRFRHFGDIVINDGGEMVFQATLAIAPRRGLFSGLGGGTTIVEEGCGQGAARLPGVGVREGTGAKSGWLSIGTPRINDQGTIAFSGFDCDGEHGVWLVERGEFTKILGHEHDFTEHSPVNSLSLNNRGEVAVTQSREAGVWIASKAGVRPVLQVGDPLDGSTVKEVHTVDFGGLNDSGQVAVQAFLENGIVGIYRADPTDDP